MQDAQNKKDLCLSINILKNANVLARCVSIFQHDCIVPIMKPEISTII